MCGGNHTTCLSGNIGGVQLSQIGALQHFMHMGSIFTDAHKHHASMYNQSLIINFAGLIFIDLQLTVKIGPLEHFLLYDNICLSLFNYQ